jgi:hypothetical protein
MKSGMRNQWSMVIFLGLSTVGFSNPLKKEGYVRNVGPSGQTMANIGDGLDLCPVQKGELAKRLSGYMVSVEGTKDEKKNCIEVSKIAVLKSSRGEPVILGVLKKVDTAWVLEGEDGKSYSFLKVPKGMRALENKKLLVDAAQTPGAQTWKVVSYMINPITE